jgi:hypothetical protein
MPLDAIRIFTAFCSAYAARDLELALRYVTDDVVATIFVDRELASFGGVTIGRAALRARWQAMADGFELPEFRAVSCSHENDRLRALIAFQLLHRGTGQEISGSFRTIVNFRDDLICRMESHHDRARMEAFLRLIAKPDGPLPEPDLD